MMRTRIWSGCRKTPGNTKFSVMSNILIVDDDEDLLDSLQDLLEVAGHQVVVSTNGNDAITKLEAGGFDLILMDWMLSGGVSGVDLCARYRAAGGLTPVVILSGMRGEAALAAGTAAGASDYLTKPFSVDAVLNCIKKNLGETSTCG